MIESTRGSGVWDTEQYNYDNIKYLRDWTLRLLENRWQSIGESIVELETKNSALSVYWEHKRLANLTLFETAETAISDLHHKVVHINSLIDTIFLENSDLFVVSTEFV